MHKKQGDQQHLGHRDHQRHHDAEVAQVYERHQRGEHRKNQQREQHCGVSLGGIDVFVRALWSHGYFGKWRSIKYSKGNRKIQIMSTKCQYNPEMSTGVKYSAEYLPFLASRMSQVRIPTPTTMCRACKPVMAK